MAAQVAIFGSDGNLLKVRASVFAAAGMASECKLARSGQRLEVNHHALSVICTSVAPEEQGRVAEEIWNEAPETKILAIRRVPDRMKSDPEKLLVCSNRPEEIVAVSQSLLS